MTEWRQTRVKNLCRVIDKRAGSDQPPLLSVSIHHGVVPRHEITTDPHRADELANYKLCERGDLVLNRMRAFQGAVGIAASRGVVSPDYLVLRPESDTLGSFLNYVIRSSWFVGEMVSRLRGIGGTESGSVRTPRINAEDLADISVSLPSLELQRKISDFLDAEMTRCDSIAVTQTEVARLLHERKRSLLEELLVSEPSSKNECSWVPLHTLTDVYRPIMYGIVLPGPNVDEGVPIVKGGDVAAGRLLPDLLCRTTVEIESRYVRSRLTGGDLVIAIRGSVGEIGTVPDSLNGANLTQDAARISIGTGVTHNWLKLVLQTPSVTDQLASRTTGATIRGINIWDLKRIMIPVISRGLQIDLASHATSVLERQDRLGHLIDRQIKLAMEQKQTLITAAVTGQLDVSTARGADLS